MDVDHVKTIQEAEWFGSSIKVGSFFLHLFLWAAAEVDDSQESSIMTDADDTQLHTAESDDVL